jgi:hypothetical protein
MLSRIHSFQLEDTRDVFVKENYARILERKQVEIFTWALEWTPMAYFGVQHIDHSTGLLWVRLNADARKKLKHMIDAVDYVLSEFLPKELKIYKAQAVIKCDNIKAIKFAEFFGFNREGVVEDYGQDREPHFLYGRSLWQYR